MFMHNAARHTHYGPLLMNRALVCPREKPSTPFRCLDPQYRRELVRVYLTNVEGVCRRFCDDKKQRLLWVKDEVQKFRDFWVGLSTEQQRKLLAEKADGILKVSLCHKHAFARGMLSRRISVSD